MDVHFCLEVKRPITGGLTLYKWQCTHIFDSKLPKTWLWLDGLLKNKKKYLVNFTLPHNVTHSLKLMSFVSGWSNIHYNNLMWLNEIQAESNSRQCCPNSFAGAFAFTALHLRLAHYVQVASHCLCLLACFLPSLNSLW